ncbi:MAG: EAL domain-containing protein [Actinomycetota bacterium]|nr:EAL domain-containing protein [Actinomycetota bacterium]
MEPVPDSLDEILRRRAVTSVYQPIVELASGRVVGYEALARGPAGSSLERPDLLFEAARREGRLGELDWACRSAAVIGAIEGRFAPSLTLFVNVEPDALAVPTPPSALPLVDIAVRQLRIVVEVTERAIANQPAELLTALARIRQLGWGVAVDDVGTDARSLAIMPFLRPDVVKLDLRLVRNRPDPDIAATVNAVNAHAERTGAVVLAEGIETEEHLDTALAIGATMGQGWRFGYPGPLPATAGLDAGPRIPFLDREANEDHATPWDVVEGEAPVRVGDKRLLAAMSRRLEANAEGGEAPVVLSCFQHSANFSETSRRRYAAMARRLPFVAALGIGMAHEPAPGVRGAALRPDDPLRSIWAVHVLGPYFSGALVARDLADDGPPHRRRLEFALTYRRDLVIRSAQALLRRIVPLT